MMSLRVFTRSVPRTFSRSIATSSFRPIRAISKPSLIQSAWVRSPKQTFPAFSTSTARYEPAGEVDLELAAKFHDELSLETETGELEQLPENIKQFLDNSPWELQDKPGEEEVILTRKFGDEKIRVSFTIADLQNLQDESEFDPALQDELNDGAINEGNTKGRNANVAPEDKVAPSDRESEGLEDEQNEPSYPSRVNVTIEKAGKGAMHVETIAQDGMVEIENVSYFNKPELANAETAEKEWTRQSLYSGPPFGNLDENLQVLLERYLEERGVDAALATFVPDYIDFKEQREYVRWLGNLKDFVTA